MKKILHLSTRLQVALIIIFALVIFELLFDPVEIILGNILYWTNPLRPKIGRLWTEEHKDRAGSGEVALLSETATEGFPLEKIADVDALVSLLSIRGEVMITRENFLSLYKTLPPRTAEKIINPMDLIDLDHQNEWHFARFVMDENELQIYLQDASGQVLYDSHPAKDILSQGNEAASYETTLQQFPEFADRIIPANTFNEAYERLSRAYRIQVINNPYKLIQWGDDLKNVAISKYSENGVVVIACEVISHNLNSVYRFEASEIAVSHLIVIINHISDDIQISQPVARMK